MQTNDTGADRTGRQGKPEQNEAQEKNQTGLPPSNLSLSLFFLKETNWYEQVDVSRSKTGRENEVVVTLRTERNPRFRG